MWKMYPLDISLEATQITSYKASIKGFPSGAVTAKSLQSCPTLCDPGDSLLPGSSVPGILQAKTLEWVAISFSSSMKVKSESEVAQLCPTLSDLMDCSLPGSSVHGIFQARVLEWGAIAFSTSGASGKEFICQCRRCKRPGFNSQVGKIPWRRKFHGQRNSPWGCKELDVTECTHTQTHTHTQSLYSSFRAQTPRATSQKGTNVLLCSAVLSFTFLLSS